MFGQNAVWNFPVEQFWIQLVQKVCAHWSGIFYECHICANCKLFLKRSWLSSQTQHFCATVFSVGLGHRGVRFCWTIAKGIPFQSLSSLAWQTNCHIPESLENKRWELRSDCSESRQNRVRVEDFKFLKTIGRGQFGKVIFPTQTWRNSATRTWASGLL